MHPILAQTKEAIDAAQGWGEQLPALALGLVAMLVLVVLFLRFLKEMSTDFRTALKEQHDATLKVATDATLTQRETNQLLGQVKSSLDQVGEESSKTRGVLHKTEQALNLNTAALQAATNRG